MPSRARSSWIVLLTMVSTSTLFAGNLSVSGDVQGWNGKYIYETTTTTYALNLGMHYEEERIALSLSLPILFQNSDLVGRSGGMMLPHSGAGGSSMPGSTSHHGGGMMLNSSQASSFVSGVGDIQLMGNYRVAEQTDVLPSVAITAQTKVPTANTTFSTGEWDCGGGIALNKQFGTIGTFANVGYLVLGDPPGVDYQNPWTYGIGVGNVFADGKFSIMLNYEAYTRVLENYDAPRETSIGILYQISPSTSLSAISSFGLSGTTPGVGVAIGTSVVI
jgi:hypothetical protein